MFVLSACFMIRLFGLKHGQTQAEGLDKSKTSQSPSAGLQRDPFYLQRLLKSSVFDANLTQGF